MKDSRRLRHPVLSWMGLSRMPAFLCKGIGALIPQKYPPKAAVTRDYLVRWFMATDERNPWVLDIARAKGAIVFGDLLEPKPQLRRLLGWPMLFMDVQALVEQEIMARSAFFFAYDHTSVAGGVANIRTARGMDPRTMILDRDPRHDPSPLSS